MRRLAQSIVGLLALAMMMTELPWYLDDCPPESCTSMFGADWWSVIVLTLVPLIFVGTILTVVLVGVLGIRDAGRSSEGAVYAALGQSQASAARSAALRGLRDGAVATGIAYAATGILHVVFVLQAGYGWASFPSTAGLWLARAVLAVAFTAMLVVAHVVDSVRPRRTPVGRLHEDAAAPHVRRLPLAKRALILGGLMLTAGGVLVGVALAHDPSDGDAGTISQLAAQWSAFAIGLAAVALFFSVGVPLLRRVLPRALRTAARAAERLRAPQVAAVLHARASTASGASARTVLAIAGLALLAGTLAAANPAPTYAPNYVGTLTLHPAGVGAEVSQQVAEIDGVQDVVVGITSGGNGHAGPLEVVGVDPADLVGVDDALASLLNEHPGAIVVGSWYSETTLDSLAAQGVVVSGIVPTSMSSPAFVDITKVPLTATGTAVLAWGEPGADLAAVGDELMNFTPESDAVLGWGGSAAHFAESTDPVGTVYLVGLIVLVCIGPIVALAYGVVSSRRRADATLAALGATRRTLTASAVAETTVIAAVAVTAGLVSGAATHATLTATSRARDSLIGVITDSYLHLMVGSVAWAALAWMLAIAVAAFAVVAWIVSSRVKESLPAEELRAAATEVLS